QVSRLLIAASVDERMIEILGSKARLFDAYVRHSTIAQAAPGAVDISEVQLARMIVAQEQERLACPPAPAGPPGPHPPPRRPPPPTWPGAGEPYATGRGRRIIGKSGACRSVGG